MSLTDSDFGEALRLIRSGNAARALPLLRAITERATAVGPAHALYLETLVAVGERREALSALEGARRLPATSADALDALAFFALKLDQHQTSNLLYQEAVEREPDDARLWYNLASSERSLGRLSSAAQCCNRALVLDPEMRAAVHLRSEVTRATHAANHIEDLRARLQHAADDAGRASLLYALGKELHELGAYDEAFVAFSEGAGARRRMLRYDIAQDEHKLRRIAETFSVPGSVRSGPGRVDRHIFIVGLPRSGTTLTERIIGGLDGVRSNNETNNFSTALMRNTVAGNDDVFARAARADFPAVAREYEALAIHDGFAGSVIEKLPFNYLYIGAILRAFPDAPIICVRRNAVDSCFAMYRTLFMDAYPFSYSFEELARYYAAYAKLMAHWGQLYGDRLTTVDYETLVARPDVIGPDLASRCGLPWTDDAIDITRNASVSLTASASQVREGIHLSSSGIWRKYETHLQALVELLMRAGVDLGAAGVSSVGYLQRD